MTRRRIGLFGGTFDPPHVGHLAVAAAVAQQCEFDPLLMVVAADPWQKRDDRRVTPAATRLAMLNAAVAGHPDLRVDDREVKRGGTTYTYDTVIELQEENPDAEISLVLGADAVSRLGTWHRSAELSQRVKVVMVARPGHQPNVPEGWKVTTVMAPQIDISSTALRDAVAAERTIEFLVPDSVRDLILREGLYRVGRD